MLVPLQVTFRGMDPSAAVEERVRERAAKLDRYSQRIIGCHVVVESPHNHHYKGKVYRVSVTVTVPGEDIVVSREPSKDRSHEDLYVAIRDAFDATTRQIETYSGKQRTAQR